MWDMLDFRDYELVRVAQRELWREAEERALQRQARKARAPRRTVIGALTARLRAHRHADVAAAA